MAEPSPAYSATAVGSTIGRGKGHGENSLQKNTGVFGMKEITSGWRDNWHWLSCCNWPNTLWKLSVLAFLLTALATARFLLKPAVLENLSSRLDPEDWLGEDWLGKMRGQVVAMVALAALMALFVGLTRMIALRMLLSYHGWIYRTRGPPSSIVLLWAFLVRVLSGAHPSMLSLQHCLPRLPVPDLHGTVDKFLASMEPLLGMEEMVSLRREAQEFCRQEGPGLQRILWLKSWWSTNYVSDWWCQYAYLMSRKSLATSSNYYGLDQLSWIPTRKQSARAAGCLWLFYKFTRMIEGEELSPMFLRDTIPLCMDQYTRLASTTRVPGAETDKLRRTNKSTHVVVVYRGLFYRLDMVDLQGQPLSARDLQTQMENMISLIDHSYSGGNSESAQHCVASLTSAERDVWYEAREQLRQLPTNVETLEVIETALCFASFSNASPSTPNERAITAAYGAGDGIWFDKSICFQFYANGRMSINVEHSWGDGPIPCHLMEFITPNEFILDLYAENGNCTNQEKVDNIGWSERQEQLVAPKHLQWQLTAAVEKVIKRSLRLLLKAKDEAKWHLIVFDEYGKDFVGRKCKLSPDGYVQMVLQAAYFRDSNGKFPLTYEPAMTRLYRNGRTETIRTLSKESAEAVRAMESAAVSPEKKYALLKKSIEKHQETSRQAMLGHGVDRHLFALYVASSGIGKESAFLRRALLYPWTLSTSQQTTSQTKLDLDYDCEHLRAQIPLGGGFSPVAEDGYGVSYNFAGKARIGFHVSSLQHAEPGADADRLASHIVNVLRDWRSVLESEISSF